MVTTKAVPTWPRPSKVPTPDEVKVTLLKLWNAMHART
jgi:hypothetical protein